MSYSQIRKYFNGEILKVEPDFKEWRDALVVSDAQNIPNTLLDTRYHIEVGAVTSTPAQDLSVEDQGTVILTLFRRGFNNPLLALDSLLDSAHCIRHQLINPQNIQTFNGDIDAVESVSITPSEIDASNDNTIQVQLEFNVRMYFCVI